MLSLWPACCRLAFAVVSGVRSTAAQAMLQWRQAVQQGRREDQRRDFATSLLRVRYFHSASVKSPSLMFVLCVA
jgi:hypothetical protein